LCWLWCRRRPVQRDRHSRACPRLFVIPTASLQSTSGPNSSTVLKDKGTERESHTVPRRRLLFDCDTKH
jgi:hypothetical protein